jgi:hypothetical protein
VATYDNSYLNLSIDIPPNWTVVSWKHKRLHRSQHGEYQFRDDELPREVGRCKVLFTAYLYEPGSDVYLDAEIELRIYREAAGYDMRASLQETHRHLIPMYESNGMSSAVTGEGRWTIDGTDLGYVDKELTSHRGRHRYRILYRRLDSTLWFYGKIAGHNDRAFAEAIEVVEGLDWRGGRSELDDAADRPRD